MPLISGHILLELERVLRLQLEFSTAQTTSVLEEIRAMCELVSPIDRLRLVDADDADNRILECALDGKAQYLVTVDRHHLLPLVQIGDSRIVSPSDFLELWEACEEHPGP